MDKGHTVTKTNATAVTRIFIKYQVTRFGIPEKLLTNNGPKFMNQLFVAACGTVG